MFYHTIQQALEAAVKAKGGVPAKPILRRPTFTLRGEQHRRDLPSAVLATIKRGQER